MIISIRWDRPARQGKQHEELLDYDYCTFVDMKTMVTCPLK
jgi:hypothetical protein